MEHAGKSKESISKSKTKRGYGKKTERRNKTNKINLSIMGTNANGLKPKMESFYHNINKFKPSICTIQETKHNKVGIFKIPGYQTFEKLRNKKGGGGLLTSVDEDLNPVLVSNCKDDIEILTVEAKLGDRKIRIINGYGPQEDDDVQDVLGFWQELEEEVIRGKDEGCFILIEMDANAKVGHTIIKGDPHKMSNNGKLLHDIIERRNLVIRNSLDLSSILLTCRSFLTLSSEEAFSS